MSRFGAGAGALLGTAGGIVFGGMAAESLGKPGMDTEGAFIGAVIGGVLGAAIGAGSCPPCTMRSAIGTGEELNGCIPLPSHPRFP